jgi:BirA family biotin operon repressor/biotin-[acetyl-CoA-carboxylase] ligase
MIIAYDNLDTLQNFISKDFEITETAINTSSSLKLLYENLFGNTNYKLCQIGNIEKWNNLLLTGFAERSQFDLINDLVSKNFDMPDKMVCLADQGNGFHGFRNRAWKAEKGNLHLTVYFKPQENIRNFHAGLLIVAAVSVIQTIDLIPGLTGKAKTKWVNDIIIDNSKVCGIITKSFSTGNKLSGAVIGIGLNVLSNPKVEYDLFTNSTTSLKSHSDDILCNLQFVLQNLLKNLSLSIDMLNNGGYEVLLDQYCNRSGVIGKNVEIYSDPPDGKTEYLTRGTVLEINNNLELILDSSITPIRNGRLSVIHK